MRWRAKKGGNGNEVIKEADLSEERGRRGGHSSDSSK